MDRILNRNELDASIRSFMSRKCDKFDVPVMPSQAKNGIRSRLAESQKLMRDCMSGDYIWSSETRAIS